MLNYPLGVVGPWQLIIIVFVILLLFGGKKIPELMKGLGKGVRSFKEGMAEIDDQLNETEKMLNEPARKKEEKKEE